MRGPTHDGDSRRAYLAQALKALRQRRGLGTAEIAAALGMPKRTYQHFESGRTQINVDRVHQIARILNADPHAIFAAAELGSPAFAVRAADNKLMTIIIMALSEFDKTSADQITLLDPRLLTTTFETTFRELATQARLRASLADKWKGPGGGQDPNEGRS
jgi:transcriptional regulator with XRE-family HTH domain